MQAEEGAARPPRRMFDLKAGADTADTSRYVLVGAFGPRHLVSVDGEYCVDGVCRSTSVPIESGSGSSVFDEDDDRVLPHAG